MSRFDNTIKNIKVGYIAQILSMVTGFVSRTIFIYTLGMNYLGVAGLFTNVLGVLSLAEMGIGTTMNYMLYKPMAQRDTRKIQLLMSFYKKVYRIIAAAIFVVGIALIPFLKFMINDSGNVGNIYIYYLIYLFNTVISYFVTYQFCLINAEQKTYINTLFNTGFSMSTSVVQIIFMFLYRNYLLYLVIGMVSGIVQKVILHFFFKKRYPFLNEKINQKLPDEEMTIIKKNVGGLIWHKIGDVAIHQTDNIIVSTLMNTYMVAIVDNYNLIINYLQTFLMTLFSNVVPSMGNMVAERKREECFKVYKVYDFVDVWIYGFCSTALLCLFQPFISLWIGSDKVIDEISLILICMNFYFGGRRVSFQNYKTVYGVFYDDKYVVLVSAIINLVLSILCGKYMGVKGIYIGTVISGLYQTIRRPMIAYERITGDKPINYFKDYLKNMIVAFVPAIVIYILFQKLFKDVTIIKFLIMMIVVVLIPNLWYYFIYRECEEFKYMKNTLATKIKVKVNRGKL